MLLLLFGKDPGAEPPGTAPPPVALPALRFPKPPTKEPTKFWRNPDKPSGTGIDEAPPAAEGGIPDPAEAEVEDDDGDDAADEIEGAFGLAGG